MKSIIVGNGIAGLSSAHYCALNGDDVLIVSIDVPQRSQSIMASGGINAAISDEDSVQSHIEDTLRSGKNIDSKIAIKEMCETAPFLMMELEKMGMLFSKDDNKLATRLLAGQSHKRTLYSKTATGKQLVTCLVNASRKFEKIGRIKHVFHTHFLQALIKDNKCYGIACFNDYTNTIDLYYGDKIIIATGGQNLLFGKTTGSYNNDGFVQGKLFTQGVTLKNLEFIQYHPTTIETVNKKIMISEATRAEGGRLFYLNDNNERIYFMEDKYGKEGNLMPRDVISKEIYDIHKQIYLDVSFLDEEIINNQLKEVKDLCQEYLKIDILKEAIPVSPSAHFFMGGIAVNEHHQTNIENLYAVGEAASLYHGANRLGGNSLLSALYAGYVVGKETPKLNGDLSFNDVKQELEKAYQENETEKDGIHYKTILDNLAKVMNECLGIVRSEEHIEEAIKQIDEYLKIENVKHSFFYKNYALKYELILAKAICLCALNRKETRGAHMRIDYPEMKREYEKPTYINYKNGLFEVK